MPDLLFVYGSLRAGETACHLLSECSFVGTAAVAGVLGSANGYPLLVAGPGWVHGELYRLPGGLGRRQVLEALDQYEGVPGGAYIRSVIRAGGTEAWTYVGSGNDYQPDG